MTIREAIIEALEKSGLSQSELARRAGLTQSRVNDFILGKRDATTETADKIMEVLGLTISAARRRPLRWLLASSIDNSRQRYNASVGKGAGNRGAH